MGGGGLLLESGNIFPSDFSTHYSNGSNTSSRPPFYFLQGSDVSQASRSSAEAQFEPDALPLWPGKSSLPS